MMVGAEDKIGSGEGRDQHEQRGLRQVEIGQQCADDAETVARIDKDVGIAAAGVDASFAGLLRREFKGADGSGTDGDYAAATGFCRVDGVGGCGGDFVGLAVEFVVFDFFGAYRLERAESDVKSDFCDFNSAGANALEDFGCEVKTRGRGGYRSSRFCVDGLVAVAIGWVVFSGDVGRERDMAQALDT